MNKHSHITSTVFRLAVLVLAMAGAGSAIAANNTTAIASGTVVTPLDITTASDLAFGSFAVSAAGSVTVTPGGVRSVGGGVTAIASTTSSAAKFDVVGTAGMNYALTLDAPATLTTAGGVNSMPFAAVSDTSASAITSGTVAGGTLTGGGQSIYVGGVLTVAANQAPGAYSGTITATVAYN